MGWGAIERQLTAIDASDSDMKGICTVIVICPAAATIRLIAADTTGCDMSVSAGDWASYGASNEGKSSVDVGVVGRENSDVVGKLVIAGDGGGDA